MKDFIGIYDNALSSEQCKQVIENFESFDVYDTKESMYRKDERECDSLPISFERKDNAPTNQIVGKTLFDYFPKYLKVNPDLNGINTFSLFYGFNIQRYKPNQCYWSPHCENDGNNLDRLLAWTIYLNTVTDGGGTHYTQYNKTIDAVEGRLVIWPAYWTHFHHGVVSKSQTKYIATGWYTFIKPLGQGQLKNWVML